MDQAQKLKLVAWLIWAVVGFGFEPRVAWVAPYLIFAGALALWQRRRWVFAYGLQIMCAAALGVASHGWLPAVLFVLTAAEACAVISRRAGLGVIGLQSAFLAALHLSRAPSLGAAAFVMSFVAFQLFALAAMNLADSEAHAREELMRVNAELVATQELLRESAEVAERARVAREVHDALGHYLTGLNLQLEAARHASAPAAALAHLEQAQATVRELFAETRRVVTTLSADPTIDLRAALTTLVAGMRAPRVTLSLPENLPALTPQRAHALFRCVQEICTNARRHAEAHTLSIAITVTGGRLRLSARDDGRGAAAFVPGFGLTAMQERVREAGGEVAFTTAAGQGFCVELSLACGAAS